MSGLINKVKAKVEDMKADSKHGDHTSTSTNNGPHNSNAANKVDPRVDSDLDGSRNAGLERNTATTGAGYGTSGIGSSGANSTYTGTTSGTNTTAGPHSSNMANKLDPRVDSDLDGSRTAGKTGYGSSTTGTSGYGSSTTGASGYGSSNTTAGPHSSNLANKMDPRVDSNLDGSRTAGNTGYGSSTTGTSGYGSSNTTVGPHSSNMANKADPRVDSDLSGTTQHGQHAHHGHHGHNTGVAGTNEPVHNSAMLNKADP